MINFTKKLKLKETEKKKNPIDIYELLDRRTVAGPLRPTQELILKEWFESKIDQKNLIIKLSTGEGKTLIGLLILQSKLNMKQGPCIYICPNKYLVDQVAEEAKKFGIKYCLIENENYLPDDFLNGNTILITHIQKLFNGKSIFGLNNKSQDIGCIILDDAHACIDSIENSFSIEINRRNHEDLYLQIFNLFKSDLIEQGEGTALEIEDAEFESMIAVPYWAWDNKKSEILRILSKNKEQNCIKYTWPLIKDMISSYKCYISGEKIEILSYNIPISTFGSFSNAKNRILMSATTQNDSFFVKGLGFTIDSIKNPLINTGKKWSGEKMIIIPSLINDEECDRSAIVKLLSSEKIELGKVALVPSFKSTIEYEKYGGISVKSENIFKNILNLKNNDFDKKKMLVLANRYDGIDLPDDSCRILLVDSVPHFNSLSDTYQETCRPNSDIINIKKAQKIEQALGRSVRGERDYSVIILIGADLVNFIRSTKSKKYFSLQTRKQVDIGLNLAEFAKEDLNEHTSAIEVIKELIKQCISREDGWKEYYNQSMNEIEECNNEKKELLYKVLELESRAEQCFINKNYQMSCEIFQEIIDKYIECKLEKSWYLQELARCTYFINKTKSIAIQKQAFSINSQLLKPKEIISYKKINYIDESRIKKIKKILNDFENFEELKIFIDDILDNLEFGKQSEKFESSLDFIGKLLGFETDRPDKTIKKGPDNLWCVKDKTYLMFECKNQVLKDRKSIKKSEAGQFNCHCGWFKEEYNNCKSHNFIIIPTKRLAYDAHFNDDVKVIRESNLKNLKNNIKGFLREFESYDIHRMNDETILKALNNNNLKIDDIINNYAEEYFHNSK